MGRSLHKLLSDTAGDVTAIGLTKNGHILAAGWSRVVTVYSEDHAEYYQVRTAWEKRKTFSLSRSLALSLYLALSRSLALSLYLALSRSLSLSLTNKQSIIDF